MIAKLERTQSNVHQNKDKHRTPTNNGKYSLFQLNLSTFAFKYCAAGSDGEDDSSDNNDPNDQLRDHRNDRQDPRLFDPSDPYDPNNPKNHLDNNYRLVNVDGRRKGQYFFVISHSCI